MSTTQSIPKVQLYAELLANILQTRLFVTIQDSKPSISVDLDSSRSVVIVSYNGEKFSLQLPSQVSENSQYALKSPAATPVHSSGSGRNGEAEFSFRLPIATETRAAKDRDALYSCYGIQVPWTAKDMSSRTNIRCRACSIPIFVPKPDVHVLWKDLPSLDWAEMMDLWHCHKPDVPQTEAEGATNGIDTIENVKGYGAANRVACSPGTVFVNVTSFIIAESECHGLKKREKSTARKEPADQNLTASFPHPASLCCESCGEIVGEVHISLQGFEIYKSAVSILRGRAGVNTHDTSDNNFWDTLSSELIISSQLLEAIDRVGARRFIVHTEELSDKNTSGLLLWVFNLDMRYSCNKLPHSNQPASAQRALKVLYQDVEDTSKLTNSAPGTPISASLEELCLPSNIYREMDLVLKSSNKLLPPSGRKFQEWHVGLLNLFEEAPPKSL